MQGFLQDCATTLSAPRRVVGSYILQGLHVHDLSLVVLRETVVTVVYFAVIFAMYYLECFDDEPTSYERNPQETMSDVT